MDVGFKVPSSEFSCCFLVYKKNIKTKNVQTNKNPRQVWEGSDISPKKCLQHKIIWASLSRLKDNFVKVSLLNKVLNKTQSFSQWKLYMNNKGYKNMLKHFNTSRIRMKSTWTVYIISDHQSCMTTMKFKKYILVIVLFLFNLKIICLVYSWLTVKGQ